MRAFLHLEFRTKSGPTIPALHPSCQMPSDSPFGPPTHFYASIFLPSSALPSSPVPACRPVSVTSNIPSPMQRFNRMLPQLTSTTSHAIISTVNRERTKRMNRHGKPHILHTAVFLSLSLLAIPAPANILYVNLNNPNPSPPYATWATAAVTIQDAVNAASPGDQILVTNGVYATGLNLVTVSGTVYTNRISVFQPLFITSVNGPQFTTIDGGGQVRCMFLTNGVTLTGFTFTNGNATNSYGGGAFCYGTVTVSNCVFSGNSAEYGGGCSGGTICASFFSGNTANQGGGCEGSTVYGGNFTNNSAEFGGGASGGNFYNCTFVRNIADTNGGGDGGGAIGAVMYNCLLVGNAAPDSGVGSAGGYANGGGGASLSSLYNCTLVGNIPFGLAGNRGFKTPNFAYAYNCLIYSNAAADAYLCQLDHCCATAPP